MNNISIPFLNGKPHPIVFVIRKYKVEVSLVPSTSFTKVRKEICKIISNILGIEKFFANNPNKEWLEGKKRLDFLRDVLKWCVYELNLSENTVTTWFDWVQKGFASRKPNKKK